MDSNNNKVKLGVFTLIIMNITAVVGIKGLPEMAGYGLSSAFYYLLAAIIFLIPTSLVAAELAAMLQDKQGGVFRWVGEAFGKHFGFLAIWLQWMQSLFWFLTTLIFGAVAIAFIGHNLAKDLVLSNDKNFTIVVVLFMFWAATLLSFKGMDWIQKITKVGGLIGTIIPAVLLVVLGVIYLATGGKPDMNFHGSFVPDLSNFGNIVLAVSIFSSYAGMEMNSIHISEVKDAPRNYPKAIFWSALVIVLIFVLGTFALGIIIPSNDISLTNSVLIGFDNYFSYIKASWLSPVIAVCLFIGVFSAVMVWVSGPSQGIFVVGKAGYLPPFLQKTNKIGVPKNILLIQAGLVSLLSLFFITDIPINTIYQIFIQLSIVLYQLMYMFMFAAAIILRYSMKDTDRPFRIGKAGNNLLIWVVAGIGFFGSFSAFLLSFRPPAQIEISSTFVWFAILLTTTLVIVIIPFIIYFFKKMSWTDPDSTIASFHWEKKRTLRLLLKKKKILEEQIAEQQHIKSLIESTDTSITDKETD